MSKFMRRLEKNETKVTEKGALGYVTSGHKLVDLNFAIPSFRESVDTALFEQALNEDKNLALRWLLYLRDIREGVGERDSFISFFAYLSNVHTDLAVKFLENINIAEYGRWDDYIKIFFAVKFSKIKHTIKRLIRKQLNKDVEDYYDNKPISLLAKWLPSENASSPLTRYRARIIREWFIGLNQRGYRKTLSNLRKYIDVVERKMSNQNWSEIDYSKVPSKANLLYKEAFLRNDKERRENYLNQLKEGKTKINAQALFLHDIVSKYKGPGYIGYLNILSLDETLEQMWKSQPKVKGFKNTLVVRDGSGSMTCPISNTGVSAIDVADAITLYCAQNNQGEFKDKFITFASRPQLVTVNSDTLCGNLNIMNKFTDYTTTNVEAVFDLILKTAINEGLTQEDLPETVLIVSDMEFDIQCGKTDEKLFEFIGKRYSLHGYHLPKLVFWNVNSRTNTIPITQNEAGVILLSGFSRNLMEMVMSTEIDPYKALVNVLNKKRYDVVDSLFK